VDFARAVLQKGFRIYKLREPKIKKNDKILVFIFLSSFIIEQWRNKKVQYICRVLPTPFCDAAVAKSPVM
jgi:hypothetical protein